MSNRSRKLIASFLLLGGLLLVACSKPEDKLVGTWGVDLDATIAADEKLKAMPEDQRKMATEFAQKMFAEASFEFTKDGKMLANFAGKKEEGSYTVKSAEGDKIVLSTKGKDGKEEDMTVEASADKLVLSIKDQKMFLKKK
ncbi:MAG TPA: hypothetical protein VLS89_09575 [Candidatus Nanopelagicales bacterium]|nr:hypothetical protein [Candidatus Nanopelagicales bacterium]